MALTDHLTDLHGDDVPANNWYVGSYGSSEYYVYALTPKRQVIVSKLYTRKDAELVASLPSILRENHELKARLRPD